MRLIVLGFAYFASAKLGYLFAVSPIGVSPVWPPTGVALAGILLLGPRALPAIFISSLITHVLIGMGPLACVGSSIGSTLEAWVGAYGIRRFVGSGSPLERPSHLFIFFVWAAMFSTLFSAAIGVTSLCLSGDALWIHWFSLARVWWLGDMFGNLIVAPFILAWSPLPKMRTIRRPQRWIEATVMAVVILGFSQAIFGGDLPEDLQRLRIETLFIPLFLLATFRYGARGATSTSVLFTMIAAWGTAEGHGPFFTGNYAESLHLLQLFVGANSSTMLFAASVRTQHKKAQKALKHSEALYYSLIENLPLSVFQKDVSGRLTFGNKKFAEASNLSIKEMLGKTDYDLYPKELAEKYVHDDQYVLQTGKIFETVEKYPAMSGFESFIHVVKSPVRDSDGNVAGILGAFWDVTERKQAEEALREAKRAADAANLAKTEFLANMSHEMRTPLGAILGFVEKMELTQPKGKCLQDINRIRRSVGSLTELIDDILDLSKIEAGKLKVDKTQFSLVFELGDTYSTFKPQADEKGLELKFVFDGPIPKKIYSDPSRLRQILFNIIGNAIKFTQVGHVQVRTQLQTLGRKNEFVFWVEDTGCGIPKSQQSSLFQPFVQADNSTTRKYGGTGLGLILSRRLARALGGDVRLMKSTPNRGSVFEVRIDAGETASGELIYNVGEAQIAAPPPKPVPIPKTQLEKTQILLVEDGPDNQELISFFLNRSGAHVDIAANGKEAVHIASQKSYDVILMDIQMPILDGYAATKELRKRGFRGAIVALTAHAMTDDKKKCLDAGCDGYVTKPVYRDKLIHTVQQFASLGKSIPRARSSI